MKLQSVYNPIKKCFNVVRNSFRRASECRRDYEQSGAEILSQQNKVFVRPANQVESECVDFKSTKEMFEYAKDKVIKPLKMEKSYEYTVVANVKDNKVLAEYKGDVNSCTMSNLESLPLDDKNVVLIHGHRDSYPISRPDVVTLLNYRINQVIAIDKDGKFSMVAKRNDVPSVGLKSKEYKKFSNECDANTDVYLDMHSEKVLKEMTHSTLKSHADGLGIRYITNYPYLSER